MSFNNKVVLITGGSAGIGATTAIQFAKEGATISIVGRNEERLKNVAHSCEKFGAKVFIIKADISNDYEAQRIVKETIKNFGKLDILVNNAGILRKSGILDANFLEVYDEIETVNMRAVVRLTYYAVPHIIKAKGNIVNISSVAGSIISWPNYIAYRTSKASMNHFTKAVALELAPHGVRINSVSPGPVETDIFEGVGSSRHVLDELKKDTALNRLSKPQEIADLIVFLASDKAASITGSDYIIDNGVALK